MKFETIKTNLHRIKVNNTIFIVSYSMVIATIKDDIITADKYMTGDVSATTWKHWGAVFNTNAKQLRAAIAAGEILVGDLNT